MCTGVSTGILPSGPLRSPRVDNNKFSNIMNATMNVFYFQNAIYPRVEEK